MTLRLSLEGTGEMMSWICPRAKREHFSVGTMTEQSNECELYSLELLFHGPGSGPLVNIPFGGHWRGRRRGSGGEVLISLSKPQPRLSSAYRSPGGGP